MIRSIGFSVLLCFVAFQLGLAATPSEGDLAKVTYISPIEPTQKTTPASNGTTTVQPTHAPPTNGTTLKPTTGPTTPPSTPPSTTSTTAVPPTTNSTTTSTTTTPSPTTNSTTTVAPTTASPSTTAAPSSTSAPSPAPSDRKFDAFSFLGGFALGLGLVAIGFLSWKFYQSRQENYYHTL